MAIKTTIDSRGVVTETIAGSNDILVVANRTVENATISSPAVAGTITVAPPFHVLNPGAGGLVTGSLPTIGSEEVGLRVLIHKDETTGAAVLSGATGQPVVEQGKVLSGATLEYKLTGPTAVADLVASVLGSGNYHWVVVAGSGSY